MGTADHQRPNAPATGPFASDRLDSWKEIARYLNRYVRTVQRWEEAGGLPVYRHAQGRVKGSAVYAYKSEIDAWLRQHPPPYMESELRPYPKVRRSFRRAVWVVVAVLILMAAGFAVWRFVRPGPSTPPLRTAPLTSYPGLSYFPAISPDGRQVAFCWNGHKQDNLDVYVRLLGGGNLLRLTTHPAADGWPAWSPDSSTIAFVRYFSGTLDAELLTIPALGGDERKIQDFHIPLRPGTDFFPAASWTPDGKFIIAPQASAEAPNALVLISVETLENRPLTHPVSGSVGDCCPAITPDGTRLAFLRATRGQIHNVYSLSLGPDYLPLGEPRQLTSEPSGAECPMWTGNGREVLYVAVRDGVRTLWRVPHDGSRPAAQVQSVGPVGHTWAISRDGSRLVYSGQRGTGALWRADLAHGNVSRILHSSAYDSSPDFAPDGKKIAFLSDRGGRTQIWVSSSMDTSPRPLAPTIGIYASPPRWSPGSDQIVFECQNQDNDDVCIIPAGGSPVRRVTHHPARDILPSWSRDGKWIYFTSNRSGSFQVWKMPVNGTDVNARQITKGGGSHPMESLDKTVVYFARQSPVRRIWQVPSEGGEESQVGDFQLHGRRDQNFAVAAQGIYYVSTTDPGHWFELWFYRFATGRTKLVRRIDKGLSGGRSVSPDGRWLLFSAPDAKFGNLYMIENFR